MVWIDDTEGGFTVEGTTNEITANTVGNTCTLSLPNTVAINTLTLNSKTFQDPTTGNPTQILGLDSSNNMVWIDDTEGGFTVEGTTNEITANTVGNTCTLSFPNNTQFPTNISTCLIGNGAVAIGNNALGTDPHDVDGSNIGIGSNAGSSITTGERNICIGDSTATIITTTNDNISIGWSANNQGSGGANVCIGTGTGTNITNTFSNVLIGFEIDVPAIGSNSQVNINNMIKMNGDGIVAIGTNNHNNLSAAGNGSLVVSIGDTNLTNIVESNIINMVAIGNDTANNITTGNYNCLVGNQNMAFTNNVTSNNNVVIGNYVGQNIANGNNNIILGNLTCNGDSSNNSTCINNIVIGNNAGNTNFNTTSNNNILIGNNVDCSTNGQSNYLCVKTNVPVLYGTSSQLQMPNFKNIWNTDPTINGQILSSDTSGNLSWYTPYISTTFEFSFNGGPTNPSSLIDFGSITLINQNRLISMRIPFSFSFGSTLGYFTVGPSNVDRWISDNNLPSIYCPIYTYQFYVPACQVSPPLPPPVPQIPIAIAWFQLQVTIYSYGTIIMTLYDSTNLSTQFVSGASYMFNTYDGYLNSSVQFGGCDYGITYYDANGPG